MLRKQKMQTNLGTDLIFLQEAENSIFQQISAKQIKEESPEKNGNCSKGKQILKHLITYFIVLCGF